MAGDPALADLVGFLGRLTGEAVAADTPVKLRSVQRAALAAWSSRRTPPLRMAGLVVGLVQTPASMLDRSEGPAALPMPDPGRTALSDGDGGLGVDIEDVAAMPLTGDYRTHPFYRDNFTVAEISYAIQQRDVRASLCGMWAAKEAVVKSGLRRADPGGLRGIEIGRDGSGRPCIAGGLLSISHTASCAVAVCTVYRAAPTMRPAVATPTPAVPTRSWGVKGYAATAAILVLACAAAWRDLL